MINSQSRWLLAQVFGLEILSIIKFFFRKRTELKTRIVWLLLGMLFLLCISYASQRLRGVAENIELYIWLHRLIKYMWQEAKVEVSKSIWVSSTIVPPSSIRKTLKAFGLYFSLNAIHFDFRTPYRMSLDEVSSLFSCASTFSKSKLFLVPRILLFFITEIQQSCRGY